MSMHRAAALLPCVAAFVALGCGDGDVAPRSAAPYAADDTRPPAPRKRAPPPDSAVGSGPCAAALTDNLAHESGWGGAFELRADGCRWVATPSFRTTGHLVDAAGDPVPDARLRLWHEDSFASGRTDGRGDFDVVTYSWPGAVTHDVDVILPGPRRIHVGTLLAGGPRSTLRLPLTPPFVAVGTLVDDAGAPLEAWTVRARAGAEATQVRTEADGRFRVVAWSEGGVELELTSPSGAPRAIARRDVDPASQHLRIPPGPGAIRGRVVVPDGADAARAVARLRRVVDGTERTAAVDAAGAFVFPAVASDSLYEVTAELPGVTCPHPYECSADTSTVVLYLVGPANVVSGRALDASGKPLRSRWLRFVAADGKGDAQTMTEGDGSFRTEDARDVDYDVFLLAPGPDGRLVPGTTLGHCRGGEHHAELRAH